MKKLLWLLVPLFLLAACGYEEGPALGTAPVDVPGNPTPQPTAQPTDNPGEPDWDTIIYNQGRFFNYVEAIETNQPIGASGEIINPSYRGFLRFDDSGMLVVTATAGAFADPASLTAIAEMREKGIIVEQVQFTQQELEAVTEALWDMSAWDIRGRHGHRLASSWGIGAENAVTVWIDPYNEETKEDFRRYIMDTPMIRFAPAVTQEMRDWRAEAIYAAAMTVHDRIVPVGDLTVSRTGIEFSLQNTTSGNFMYGTPWDLAINESGVWVPFPYPPGSGSTMWILPGFTLQSGGVRQYRIEWDWRFGALPPGRYMLVRRGSIGENTTYAQIIFEVTDATPRYLPPAPPEPDWNNLPPAFVLQHYTDPTAATITLTVANESPYDIRDFRVQLLAMALEETAAYFEANYEHFPHEWQWHGLPFLPLGDDWEEHIIQGHGDLPQNAAHTFTINWEAVFGALPPGEYRLALSAVGHALPPNPTGWVFGDITVVFTVE